jgi:hypothetical protein
MDYIEYTHNYDPRPEGGAGAGANESLYPPVAPAAGGGADPVMAALGRMEARLAALEARLERMELHTERMSGHIGFVEGVYETARAPMGYVLDRVNRLLGRDAAERALPPAVATASASASAISKTAIEGGAPAP